MRNVKVGDKVIITGNDYWPRHYLEIGEKCVVVGVNGFNDTVRVEGVRHFQIVHMSQFKLSNKFLLENK